MSASLWWWSHGSVALLFAATAVAARARQQPSGTTGHRPRPLWRVGLLAVAAGLGLSVVPVGDVDVAGYLLAYSGELSFALLFFLVVYVAAQSFPAVVRVADRDWDGLRMVWAIAGLALYGSALTGWEPDVYGFGFGTLLLWPALAGSAGLAMIGRWLPAVLLLGVVWSWQLRLAGGVNFWDYAIDPFLWVVSAVRVAWSAAKAAVASGIKWGRERKLAGV